MKGAMPSARATAAEPEVSALRDGVPIAFAPGSWASFYKSKYDEWHVAVPYTNSSMLCPLFPDGINPTLGKLREGTCRLIAAAPDLYNAAEVAQTVLASIGPADRTVEEQEALNWLADALAKARGETR